MDKQCSAWRWDKQYSSVRSSEIRGEQARSLRQLDHYQAEGYAEAAEVERYARVNPLRLLDGCRLRQTISRGYPWFKMTLTRDLTGSCSGRFLVAYCQCVWRDEPMTTVLQKLLVALISTVLLAALVLWDATPARVVQTAPAHAGQVQ